MLKVQALYKHCLQGLTSVFPVQYSGAFFFTWVKNQDDTALGRDFGWVTVSYKANVTLFANCNQHNTFSALNYLEYFLGSLSFSKGICLVSHFEPYKMMPFLLLSDILFSQAVFFSFYFILSYLPKRSARLKFSLSLILTSTGHLAVPCFPSEGL